MKQEKWLIIGSGWISNLFIIDAKKVNQKIAGIWSIDVPQAMELAKKHNTKWFSKIDDIDVEYDNVYIGVPNRFHFDLAKKFIEKKKNLLVEKPMTHSYELTKELFEIGDLNHVKVMEAYPHIFPGRFKEYIGKVKELKIDFFNNIDNNTTFTSQFKKETWGGAVSDSGCYAISMAIWLNGLVKEVKVKNFKLYKTGVDESVDYVFEHDNGSLTNSTVTIVKNGPSTITVDGHELTNNVSRWIDDRMIDEVRTFIEGDYKFSRVVSIETARVIQEIHNQIHKGEK